MKPNRQKKGECSPTVSKPKSTVSRPLKSPKTNSCISTPKVDNNSDGASLIKHEKPMENTHVNYKRLLKEVDTDGR